MTFFLELYFLLYYYIRHLHFFISFIVISLQEFWRAFLLSTCLMALENIVSSLIRKLPKPTGLVVYAQQQKVNLHQQISSDTKNPVKGKKCLFNCPSSKKQEPDDSFQPIIQC